MAWKIYGMPSPRRKGAKDDYCDSLALAMLASQTEGMPEIEVEENTFYDRVPRYSQKYLGRRKLWVRMKMGEHYLIVKTKDGAMIINKRKHFDEGHTHISTMEQGEWLAKMALYKIVPEEVVCGIWKA